MLPDRKIQISERDLVELLNAFLGPMYFVNELWAIQNLPDSLIGRLRAQVLEEHSNASRD